MDESAHTHGFLSVPQAAVVMGEGLFSMGPSGQLLFFLSGISLLPLGQWSLVMVVDAQTSLDEGTHIDLSSKRLVV